MPFKKGQSGNPGGRPKQEKAVVEAARAAGDRCIEVLRELVEHGDPKVRTSDTGIEVDDQTQAPLGRVLRQAGHEPPPVPRPSPVRL